MCLNQIHLHLLPSSSSPPLFQPYIMYLLLFPKCSESTLYYQDMHESRAIYWSTGNFSEASSLNRADAPSPRSLQVPRVPQLAVGLHDPLPLPG